MAEPQLSQESLLKFQGKPNGLFLMFIFQHPILTILISTAIGLVGWIGLLMGYINEISQKPILINGGNNGKTQRKRNRNKKGK